MQEASAKGLIDKKVIALGGVRLENIPSLRQLGFGGVAQIGDIWQRIDDESYLREIRQAL
jgi:thiamine-phosphate pyrophosphorylase